MQHAHVVETYPLRNRPHSSTHSNSFPLQGMLGLSNHDDVTKGSRHEKSVTLDNLCRKLHRDYENNVKLQNYDSESRDFLPANATTGTITTTTLDEELLTQKTGENIEFNRHELPSLSRWW
jgi:hypothetical protein